MSMPGSSGIASYGTNGSTAWKVTCARFKQSRRRGRGMDAMAANTKSSADREIVTTRLVDAPPDRVFDAWTDPEQIVQWWGPRGFTTTTSTMEARPGGVWRFVMHGPDGRDYQNKITYFEVVRPERLVYR